MRLPVPKDDEIRKFQLLFEKQYGETIEYGEAREQLTHLVQFYFLTKGHDLFDHNNRIKAKGTNAEYLDCK